MSPQTSQEEINKVVAVGRRWPQDAALDSMFAFGEGIYALDAEYERRQQVAIHLVIDGGRVAIIDCGARSSVAPLLAALEKLGYGPEAVDWLCLTHVHLDHAGAAGELMQQFANARLVVHERGARHMVDPRQLAEGVKAVYGQAFFERVYGDLVAVSAERVLSASEGTTLTVGQRQLRCLDAPGHARHHLVFVDEATNSLFSGDAFGLSYREMDIGERQFIFPTTTPVQFDPEVMHQTVDRLLAETPAAIYLTHYSRLDFIADQASELHRLINAHVDIALNAAQLGPVPQRHQKIKEGLSRLLLQDASDFGSSLAEDFLLRLWECDLELNAQGLGVWLDNRSRSR